MKVLNLLVSIIFTGNNLQDHKANENHDFAVQDDLQVLQKTSQGNEPAKFVNRNCKKTSLATLLERLQLNHDTIYYTKVL